MKKFYNCNLQDLLTDDDFKFCVWENEKGNSHLWQELLRLNPEHNYTLCQARELLLSLGQKASSLTKEELNEGVAAILSHTKKRRSRLFSVHQFRWLSIAASVLIIIGLITLNHNHKQPEYTYSKIIANVTTQLQEVVNETDKEKRIILPDSSIVVLSPAGKISYTYPFIQNNRREIYLSGDAFFDIQKDTLNPLFVYTNGLATRVVGTSFLIKTTVNEVKVLVRTGRVAVTPIKSKNAASENTKELLLIPNQQALFSTRDNAILKTIIDFPDEIKKIKKEEVLSFENRPITEVFEILEKVYGVPIIYDRTAMAKCLLHVEFTNESLFQKLDIITQTIGGSYTVTDGQVMISGNGCN
jgi:transmembrane sensor